MSEDHLYESHPITSNLHYWNFSLKTGNLDSTYKLNINGEKTHGNGLTSLSHQKLVKTHNLKYFHGVGNGKLED